jgi:translation elongation factor EF-1alpha
MDIRVGKITHYYDHIGVAVIELSEELKVGETIHIQGRSTDFTQRVGSMEIEHQKIETAKPKDEVALKVIEPVREGDLIYRVIKEE